MTPTADASIALAFRRQRDDSAGMSQDPYTFADLITLEPGSWADWISGTGSFAAVAAALLGYWFVGRQREADEHDRVRSVAESVEWKILLVLNDTATIAKHFKDSLENDANSGHRRDLFALVRPLGVPPRGTSDLSPR